MKPSINIYCPIVDNYGDIGLSYRLAKVLAGKDQYSVTLWFSSPPPEIFTFLDCPRNLTLKVLTDEVKSIDGDLSITTFSCYLPDQFRRGAGKYHLDLGYMSLDLKKSLHDTSSGKHSFYPGYIDGFVLGNIPPLHDKNPGRELRISWFSYRKSLPTLLEKELEQYPRKVTLFSHQLPSYKKGSLHVVKIPFLTQNSFDKLLSTCDVNFVRGEDSFIRSQLTSAVTLWQPYDRSAEFVRVRLQTSFLDRYVGKWPKELKDHYEKLALNPDKTSIVPILDNIEVLKPLCLNWRKYLIELGDISNVIHKYVKKALSI